MLRLKDGLILYHGSYCEVKEPDLAKCAKRKDFGYISTFEIKLLKELAVHVFEEADVNWLHCIAAHRKKKLFIEVEREMAKYDVIIGKIADDATNA